MPPSATCKNSVLSDFGQMTCHRSLSPSAVSNRLFKRPPLIANWGRCLHNVLTSYDFSATSSHSGFSCVSVSSIVMMNPISGSFRCASFNPSLDQGNTALATGPVPVSLPRGSSDGCLAPLSRRLFCLQVLVRVIELQNVTTFGEVVSSCSITGGSGVRTSDLCTSAVTIRRFNIVLDTLSPPSISFSVTSDRKRSAGPPKVGGSVSNSTLNSC